MVGLASNTRRHVKERREESLIPAKKDFIFLRAVTRTALFVVADRIKVVPGAAFPTIRLKHGHIGLKVIELGFGHGCPEAFEAGLQLAILGALDMPELGFFRPLEHKAAKRRADDQHRAYGRGNGHVADHIGEYSCPANQGNERCPVSTGGIEARPLRAITHGSTQGEDQFSPAIFQSSGSTGGGSAVPFTSRISCLVLPITFDAPGGSLGGSRLAAAVSGAGITFPHDVLSPSSLAIGLSPIASKLVRGWVERVFTAPLHNPSYRFLPPISTAVPACRAIPQAREAA